MTPPQELMTCGRQDTPENSDDGMEEVLLISHPHPRLPSLLRFHQIPYRGQDSESDQRRRHWWMRFDGLKEMTALALKALHYK